MNYPKWYEIAQEYLGEKEISGKINNPKIEGFFKRVVKKIFPDETPWCAAFVGSCLIESGLNSSNALNARSYLKYGVSVKNSPQIGDIVIFWRGNPSSWQGHVAFYAGETDTMIKCLGGNQGNCVSLAYYPKARVLDIRRPLTEADKKC